MSAGPEPGRVPVVAMIGMATVDYLYVVDDFPQENTVNPALDHLTVVGGSAGRGAIAARRLGATTRLLATCGTGVHAEVLRAGLRAEGVDCTWAECDEPSQHSAVILARRGATRTILWLPQPRADARALERLPEVLDGAQVAMLDATDEALATAALDECERRGIPTVIDTGSGRPWTAALLGRVDHVIAPEKYAVRTTGRSPEEAALQLWAGSCRSVFAVTQGRQGGLFTTGGTSELLQRWEAAPVIAVDACGAGDTFHGAYAWAVAAGLPPAECVATAAWSAGLKTTQVGNRGIPTWEQLVRARSAHEADALTGRS